MNAAVSGKENSAVAGVASMLGVVVGVELVGAVVTLVVFGVLFVLAVAIVVMRVRARHWHWESKDKIDAVACGFGAVAAAVLAVFFG